MNTLTDNCLNCGKFASAESGYTDFDWSFHHPTFGCYCNEKCADEKRAKINPAIIEQVERDNGCYESQTEMKQYYSKAPGVSAKPPPFNYIVIRHGETGYYPMPYLADDEIIADMNAHAGNSPAQVEAAILCSMFDCWQNFDKITAGESI